MSFYWSASSSSSFAAIKPVATNSFADALKRLAEHVEKKKKTCILIKDRCVLFYY